MCVASANCLVDVLVAGISCGGCGSGGCVGGVSMWMCVVECEARSPWFWYLWPRAST